MGKKKKSVCSLFDTVNVDVIWDIQSIIGKPSPLPSNLTLAFVSN